MASIARSSAQRSRFADDVEPYASLITAFLSRELSAAAFEERYRTTFLADTRRWPEPMYRALNGAFLDAEAFAPGADPSDDWLIDEAELRTRMDASLEHLESLGG